MSNKENNSYIDNLPREMPNEDGGTKKMLTPEDLVRAVLGDDPKAILSAIQGKRAKRLGKNNPPTKYKSRTVGFNKDGKAVVKKVEYTEEHLAKEKAKKAAAKKAAKDKKKKEE